MTNYTHDLNGNMITSSIYEFIYNAENQLVQVKRSGVVDATYEYNWQGLRNKKTTSLKVEYYYYTGTDLTYITDGSNVLKYFFVRDTNGRLMHMLDYKVSPVKAYTYIHDVHGNIVGLADNSGSIVVSYEYDAWGVGKTPTGSVVTGSGELLSEANPFRYSGYQFDFETGLYYLKARYYSPGLGRFLTMDPMIGINRYMYANNNPINLIDPDGNITAGEIRSYKEGYLNQKQYDVLMKLTKAYYLAPDNQSRNAIHSIAEKYRRSNYKMNIGIEISPFILTKDEAYRKGLQYHIEGLVASATLGAILGGIFASLPGLGAILGFGADVAAFDNSLENVTPGNYKVTVITIKERMRYTHYIITSGPSTSILTGLAIRQKRRR